MHPEMIKAHIRMCGTTPAAIADELGVTRTAVASVIELKMKSARIRAHIAQLLGKPEAVIWPNGAKARPILRRPHPTKKMLAQMAQQEQHASAGGAA